MFRSTVGSGAPFALELAVQHPDNAGKAGKPQARDNEPNLAIMGEERGSERTGQNQNRDQRITKTHQETPKQVQRNICNKASGSFA